MGSLSEIINNENDFKQFAEKYLDYLYGLTKALDLDRLNDFVTELEDARKNSNMVFFAGNGGSASTASHCANDLTFGEREYVSPALKTMALADNSAVITALANDIGYENIFLRQLENYFMEGDKLVAISASGNSPNLIKAAEWVKAKGGKVISFLGFDGGKLKDISDLVILVSTPKGEYGPVEDVHMILDHLIYTWIWKRGKNG